MSQQISRETLASLWHVGAQLTRSEIFGPTDPIRPVYKTAGVLETQVTIPAMGTVGPQYRLGALAFVSVNPAGGKPDAISTTADEELYRGVERLRDAATASAQLEAFEHLNRCFLQSIPTWTIWRQHIDPVLGALAKTFEESAYLYLVPFRTRGDLGSSMPERFAEAGYDRHLRRQLDAIRPSLVIAVDRPSERVSRKWAGNQP